MSPPLTVTEVIRQAEAGSYGHAVEAVKSYMHNTGAQLRLCKPFLEDLPGPMPTPAELCSLAELLCAWGKGRGIDTAPLRAFVRQEQRRLAPRIPGSGFVLAERFSKAEWNDAALLADELLNQLKQPATAGCGLEIIPGGIKYGGATVSLSGKPLACISVLIDAHHHRAGRDTLRDRVWGTDSYTDDGTIKNVISDARDALRKLLRLAGKQIDAEFDPIPCVDRGRNLAWALNLPQ